MKTKLKVSLFLLIFGSFSCSVNPETESILPQNSLKTTNDLDNSARTDTKVNTITLLRLKKVIDGDDKILINFSSEKKGWDGTIKGSSFVADEKGVILTELSQKDATALSKSRVNGLPLKGQIVKGGKNPGATHYKEMVTDENGMVVLPEDWEDGEFFIIIGEKENISEFNISIKNGKIKEVDAPKMLVNQDGSVRNFYYEKDFVLDAEIAKNLEADEIIIEKGFYPVDYSNKGEGGSVVMKGKIKGKTIITGDKGKLIYEGTNPKGQDCKSWGTACFYVSGERGIDKKDVHRFTVTPVNEKEELTKIIVQYKGAGQPKQAGF